MLNLFIIIITMLVTTPIMSHATHENSIDQHIPKEYELTFSLPIAQSKTQTSSLSISIPQNFKPLQSIDQFCNRQGMMIEFIPSHEEEHEWSEIITVHKFLGKRLQASQITTSTKNHILKNGRNAKIIEESTSTKSSIQEAHFFLQYDDQNHHEVIGAYYYSGTYDSTGFQYTIRLKENQTAKDAVKTIKAFIKNNTHVIHSPISR